MQILASHALAWADAGAVQVACTYTGRPQALACDALVLVTARLPQDGLVAELEARSAEWEDGRTALRARRRRRLLPGHHRRRGLGRPPLRRGARRADGGGAFRRDVPVVPV